MGLSEKLVEIKSETEALITYANGVTGESDTRLGDAVRTLAEGYGQGGGGSVRVEHKIVTLTEESFYLPLGFDKVPELLQIFPYAPAWDENPDNRYDQSLDTDLVSHVSRVEVSIPNSWEPHSNSGNMISPQGFFDAVIEHRKAYMSVFCMQDYGRVATDYDSYRYGYTGKTNARQLVQNTFPVVVKGRGYRIGSDGKLWFDISSTRQNTNNYKFAPNVQYNITALWGITNPNHGMYFEFNRDVNSTNVTQTITT